MLLPLSCVYIWQWEHEAISDMYISPLSDNLFTTIFCLGTTVRIIAYNFIYLHIYVRFTISSKGTNLLPISMHFTKSSMAT